MSLNNIVPKETDQFVTIAFDICDVTVIRSSHAALANNSMPSSDLNHHHVDNHGSNIKISSPNLDEDCDDSLLIT